MEVSQQIVWGCSKAIRGGQGVQNIRNKDLQLVTNK